MLTPNRNNIFIAVTTAAVFVLGTTITTTAAYAQQGKACPDGYTLTKGKCVGPTIQTETTTCPDGTNPASDIPDFPADIADEYCTTGHVFNTGALCPLGTNELTTGQCINPNTGEIVDRVVRCPNPDTEILIPESNLPTCYEVVKAIITTTTTCPDGEILDTEANTCTTKPGRSTAAAAA